MQPKPCHHFSLTHRILVTQRLPQTLQDTQLQTIPLNQPKNIKHNLMIMKLLSHVRLFATPRTVAYHVPPSMGFTRQEYWSGLPFPSPGDLPNPGIEPGSPTL